MTAKFKLVLFIRFLGYALFLSGLLGLVVMLGPLAQAEASYRLDKLRGIKRTVPKIITSSQEGITPAEITNGSFGNLQASGEIITPKSSEFGIVIEKINANSKVVANVDAGNEKEYTQALANGVAHAKGTSVPGGGDNIYLFSHSTDAPWNIIRYNAVFYLLRELVPGDKIIMFYQNRRFDYVVFDKTVASPDDVSYLNNHYNQEVLTLQTCDPPGTLINRLIVRAKLVGS
ncbi:sortase [Candidatus Daviesbacteria bacterium]|nr:sortase [Candidatus Daviesbacteria bacterium]